MREYRRVADEERGRGDAAGPLPGGDPCPHDERREKERHGRPRGEQDGVVAAREEPAPRRPKEVAERQAWRLGPPQPDGRETDEVFRKRWMLHVDEPRPARDLRHARRRVDGFVGGRRIPAGVVKGEAKREESQQRDEEHVGGRPSPPGSLPPRGAPGPEKASSGLMGVRGNPVRCGFRAGGRCRRGPDGPGTAPRGRCRPVGDDPRGHPRNSRRTLESGRSSKPCLLLAPAAPPQPSSSGRAS